MSDQQFVEQQIPEVQDYENPIAWGNKKSNFYKQSQSEYSQIEDEQKEAEQIYKKQLQQLDDQDFNIDKQKEDEQIIEKQVIVNYDNQILIVKKQIKKMLNRIKSIQNFAQFKNIFAKGKLNFVGTYISVHQSYIMTLFMLLEMYKNKVVQIQKHPIVQKLDTLKELVKRFQKNKKALEYKFIDLIRDQLEKQEKEKQQQQVVEQQIIKKRKPSKNNLKKKNKNKQNEELIQIQQYLDDQNNNVKIKNPKLKNQNKQKLQQQYESDIDQFNQQGDQLIEKGLENYYKEVQKVKKQKKIIKKEKKEEFLAKLPKEVFQKIGKNQARSINYTIFKNKGLTRRRKNLPKNSRLKYKLKFKKAEIKHRSKGKGIIREPERVYEGEQVVKYGKKSGTKLS